MFYLKLERTQERRPTYNPNPFCCLIQGSMATEFNENKTFRWFVNKIVDSSHVSGYYSFLKAYKTANASRLYVQQLCCRLWNCRLKNSSGSWFGSDIDFVNSFGSHSAQYNLMHLCEYKLRIGHYNAWHRWSLESVSVCLGMPVHVHYSSLVYSAEFSTLLSFLGFSLSNTHFQIFFVEIPHVRKIWGCFVTSSRNRACIH